MVHKTGDITETRIQTIGADTSAPSIGSPLPAASGVQYTHPDPEREASLMSLVDETWPDIEETIHFLRDN